MREDVTRAASVPGIIELDRFGTRQTCRMPPRLPRVSAEDRARFARQAEALRAAESDEQGSPDLRRRRMAELDEDRARSGIPPLKTEPELHRLARSLGLIRR